MDATPQIEQETVVKFVGCEKHIDHYEVDWDKKDSGNEVNNPREVLGGDLLKSEVLNIIYRVKVLKDGTLNRGEVV